MGEEETKKTEPKPESSNSVSDQPPTEPKELEKQDPVAQDQDQDQQQQNKVTPPPVQKVDSAAKEEPKDLADRDSVLAQVETEKKLALIKAWEESEKTKAENRAHKKLTAVGLWEGSKKAFTEAQLKRIEEKLEREKAEYVEKMNNKMAVIHQSAEEKRAMVEAKRKEQFLKVEETAEKFRSSGYSPRRFLSCFSA
ncbi:hypothetical protein L6164_028210 [Bauhinia variegata]|uniref:Uncharacterized protein n=1 Tax=Bauhinia variegata TaxID=167791 RepID=A0ACB9LWX2_BAUVA|nr:hypothetical protein L6164_028210 [Bauhinia variegata]